MRIKFISVALGLMALLSACGNDGEQTRTAHKQTLKYKVATDPTLVPMSFYNEEHKLAGFEIDLMREIARVAGFDYEMVGVDWPALFGGLIAKKYDMAISSVTILEERKQRMAFSVPYLQSGLALLVRTNQEGVASVEDLERLNLLAGAQVRTTSYFYLEKFPNIRKKGYELFGHAVADLINGKIDAAVGESTGTLYFKNQRKDYFTKIKMAGEILTRENYGIVFRKEETALRTSVDASLKKLLGDGTIARLHKKWDLGKAASVPLSKAVEQ